MRPEAHSTVGFGPRQLAFQVSVYTCWRSSRPCSDSSTIWSLLPGQQWPLFCYIHWKFWDLISPGRVPDGIDVRVQFWKPPFFLVLGAPYSLLLLPFRSPSRIFRLLLSWPKTLYFGDAPNIYPSYALSQGFIYQLDPKNHQSLVLVTRQEVCLLAWSLETDIALIELIILPKLFPPFLFPDSVNGYHTSGSSSALAETCMALWSLSLSSLHYLISHQSLSILPAKLPHPVLNSVHFTHTSWDRLSLCAPITSSPRPYNRFLTGLLTPVLWPLIYLFFFFFLNYELFKIDRKQ